MSYFRSPLDPRCIDGKCGVDALGLQLRRRDLEERLSLSQFISAAGHGRAGWQGANRKCIAGHGSLGLHACCFYTDIAPNPSVRSMTLGH